jgi:type II secretory pathway predicted ATPase ExeA/pSer/pThr/pTyr-binding forkhead associated (FHA) protein
MDLATAGLGEQPFRTHGDPVTTIPYAAYRDGFAVLQKERVTALGVTLLQGPALSGKTTLIHGFIHSIPDEIEVALIDGRGLDRKAMLESLLSQFGYSPDFSSARELLAMTRVFSLQQAASQRPPVVIVENAHELTAGALRVLIELSNLQVRQTSAIKLVLASDRSLFDVLTSPELDLQAFKILEDFHLRPLRQDEAQGYLHAKLRAAGSRIPEFIFPNSVCDELWHASSGWPGVMDRIALLALANSDSLPVSVDAIERPSVPAGTWEPRNSPPVAAADESSEGPEQPMLYLSHNGELVKKVVFDRNRILIGRSEHNDLTIDSRFVSRHHMLLVRDGVSTFLMDLNSTNGTFINSRRVSNHILINDDIVTIGHHRIKFSDATARQHVALEGSEFADTVIMKTLDDMRALLNRKNTELLPVTSEDMPTIGNQS